MDPVSMSVDLTEFDTNIMSPAFHRPIIGGTMHIEPGMNVNELSAMYGSEKNKLEKMNMDCDKPNSIGFKSLVGTEDEEYLISMAKSTLSVNPNESLAWLLLAKTLFPKTSRILFEAYELEKKSGNAREAGKHFCDLFCQFPRDVQLWAEISKIMMALRSNSESSTQTFYRTMFNDCINHRVQYDLLLAAADQCEDTIDHCHLMLLLLQKFPGTMCFHGAKLVDTLMTAEKQAHPNSEPLNPFRKILVCDLLPMLDKNKGDVLAPKQLYNLLYKSLEFFMAYVTHKEHNNLQTFPDAESLQGINAWEKLLDVYQYVGKKNDWDLVRTFKNPLDRKKAWSSILMMEKQIKEKGRIQFLMQTIFCTQALCAMCLHGYNRHMRPGLCGEDQGSLLLVEVITSTKCNQSIEPPTKKAKYEDNNIQVYDRGHPSSPVIDDFIMTYYCSKLVQNLKAMVGEPIRIVSLNEYMLASFYSDAALYEGRYEDSVQLLPGITPMLKRCVYTACCLYFLGKYELMHYEIMAAMQYVTDLTPGGTVQSNIDSVSGRCLNYISVKKIPVLHYFCKLMICALEKCVTTRCHKLDIAMGHILVMIQLDWPAQSKLFNEIIEIIKQRSSWSYHLFQKYIINVDFLEEFMYLSNSAPKIENLEIALDIFPSSTQLLNHRRMSTRGIDKGAKEDFKMSMRRQLRRCNEPIDDLIIQFLMKEKDITFHNHM